DGLGIFIIELFLVHVIRYILGNHILAKLVIIIVVELVLSFLLVLLIVYVAVPSYLNQLPNEVYRNALVTFCVFIIFTILTTVGAFIYHLGYEPSSKVAQAWEYELEQAREELELVREELAEVKGENERLLNTLQRRRK